MRLNSLRSKRFVVAALIFFSVTAAVESWAKGCGRMELDLKTPTEVQSEIGKLKVQAGKVNFCWPDFKPHKEETEEAIIKGAYLVNRFKLAEATTLGNLALEKGTELSLPDIFAHGDDDFSILSGGIRTLGGVELVASPSLPIGVSAYERTNDGFILRTDGWMKLTGHLSDNVTLSGLDLTAGHPVQFSGLVTAVTAGKTSKLRLVLGTVNRQTYYAGSKAQINLELGDTVVFAEKPSDGYLQVYPLAERVLFIQNKRVVAHGVLNYREKEGTLASFTPKEDFELNGLKISGVDKGIQATVSVYSTGELEAATSRIEQEVQGIKLKFSWDPIYFWPNGKILHVAQVEDEKYRNIVWNGQKVTSFRASLSFNEKGELRLWNASQAKIAGTQNEFNGLFEVIKGEYHQVVEDSPIRKWYDWRGYNQELRDWLKK